MGDATRKETLSITETWFPGPVSASERGAATTIQSAARIPATRKAFKRPSVAATKDVPELAVSVPEFHIGAEIALLRGRGAPPVPLEIHVFEDLVLRDRAGLRRRPHIGGDGDREAVPKGLSDDEPRLEGIFPRGKGRLDGELVQADDVPEPLLHPPRVGPEDDRCRSGGRDRPPCLREVLRGDTQGKQAHDVVLAVGGVRGEFHLVPLQRS